MVSDLLEFTPDNMDPTKITSGGKFFGYYFVL